MSWCLSLILALVVGLGSASDAANGWATSAGNACVECIYKGETFDACGKWSTNYIWCCTKANNGAYINQQDTSTEVRGWGNCDLESSGPRPSPTPAPSSGGGSSSDTKTCSDYFAVWAISQALGGGCAADSKFFDLKKNSVVLSGTTEADIKAACCTAFADALCSDWATTKSCSSGTLVPTNSAPADGPSSASTFTTLSQGKFEELCCAAATPAPPVTKTCGEYSVAWVTTQVFGGGCAQDKKFFDLKKTNSEFSYDGTDASIKAGCCTAYSDATCADWGTVNTCSSGTLVGANAAPADGPAGASPFTNILDATFQDTCCTTPTPAPPVTRKCSAYSVAWAAAQLLGGGCAQDKKFFDLKKTNSEFSYDGTDASIKAGCCTAYSDATCADWGTVKTCSSGTLVGANAAPADGPAGASPFTHILDATFQDTCCTTPTPAPPVTRMCSAYRVAWAAAQFVGGGCAQDKKFFDLKKTSTEFTYDGRDASIKAACCTAFADATCADWVKTCSSGSLIGENVAPADGPSGASTFTTLSNTGFRATCCGTRTTTTTVTAGEDETSSAIHKALPLSFIIVLMSAVLAL